MDMIGQVVANAFKPLSLLLLFVGVWGGMIFGAIPGLTAVMAITIALPFTFFLPPVESITLLVGIYIGSISGGFISASLINMPGTPSSVATTFDAYPMAQKGKAGEALRLGLFSSVAGGLAGTIVLIGVAPFIAWQALKLGPFEYFSLGMFTYFCVCGLLGGNFWKNMIGICIGLFLACIGADNITSVSRLTFGFAELQGGIALLPFMIGLFVIPQLIDDISRETAVIVPIEANKIRIRELFPRLGVLVRYKMAYFASYMIGLVIGILPGIGGTTANVISYQVVKSISKHPEKFGTGIDEGIIASETANNASVGGAFVPFLALGIPGDAITAILLGALMIQGIQPGPLLFQNNADLVYAVFAANILGNIAMLIIGIFMIKFFIRVLSFPKKYLLPLITVFCILGAFSGNNRIFDVVVMLLLGLFGFFWKKQGFPLLPILIAYILEPIVEKGLREGVSMSGGSFMPLITRPISLTFLILSGVAVVAGFFLHRSLQGRGNNAKA